jgi:hypothetical protein
MNLLLTLHDNLSPFVGKHSGKIFLMLAAICMALFIVSFTDFSVGMVLGQVDTSRLD